MTKNKGYTLVELLVVIAIMMILSGLSFFTLGIIKNARRTSAVSTFDNQISNFLMRTKAISSGDSNEYSLCMVLAKRNDDDKEYVIMSGYTNGSELRATATGNDQLDASNDDQCEAVLSQEIKNIDYTADSGQTLSNLTVKNGTVLQVIQFSKSDGTVMHGAGTYKLCEDEAGTIVFDTIYLDPMSGNHYRVKKTQ